MKLINKKSSRINFRNKDSSDQISGGICFLFMNFIIWKINLLYLDIEFPSKSEEYDGSGIINKKEIEIEIKNQKKDSKMIYMLYFKI